MQGEIYFPIQAFLSALVVLSVTAALWFYALSRRSIAAVRGSACATPHNTRNLGRFFHDRVSHFKGQIQTLDEHSNEYTSVFSGDDWAALMRTITQLEEADTRIQGLIVKREFARAHQLLEEFYDPTQHRFDSIQSDIDSIRASAAWESELRSILKKVVLNLEAATSQVQKIEDPGRSRKRRPTLVTLADVKKSLLEDEALGRERL